MVLEALGRRRTRPSFVRRGLDAHPIIFGGQVHLGVVAGKARRSLTNWAPDVRGVFRTPRPQAAGTAR